MMTLAQSINDHLPISWRFTLVLCFADDDWQVNATNDEYVVIATGASIEDALMAASEKIHLEKYAGRLNWLVNKAIETDKVSKGLISLASLGLAGPPLKLRRPNLAPSSSETKATS
jgi:hypothetical protein